ncbi:MAG: DNA recombination protein RmuC [Terriglobales bacterium]
MAQAVVIIVAILCGVAIGVMLGRLMSREAVRMEFEAKLTQAQQRAIAAEASIPELRNQLKSKDVEVAELRGRLESEIKARTVAESTLAEERKRIEEQRALLAEAQDKLKDAFNSLAAQALNTNNQSFLELAKSTLEKYQTDARRDLQEREKAVENLVTPIKTSLDKVDAQIHEIEKARATAYGDLTAQVRSLIGTQEKLQTETSKLVTALRAPNVRGRWGEIQLRRVVEMADMIDYCDFEEQVSVTTSDGRLRPDLIVKLPGGKNVVVDAKAPLQAYLNALEAQDEDHRRTHLAQHARQIREHMTKLGSKTYSDQFQPAPEFVVMFLPGEAFFSAALESDPALIEAGVAKNVIPASPTTLIALLRAVAYGWRQEKLTKNAQEISQLGKQLYERLCTYASHMEKVGRSLDRAVDSYNDAVRSLETRVMVSARKFTELGPAVTNELPEFERIDKATRQLQTNEQMELAASAGSDS